ncbi:MAG: hypothetical protein KAX89_08140 [Propionivibrio sp.]|nr:hypothetical protein [Propionivibrio sp.]
MHSAHRQTHFRVISRAAAWSGVGAVDGPGDAEQAKDLALQVGELHVEDLDGFAGVHEAVALREAEQAMHLARWSVAGTGGARGTRAIRPGPRAASRRVARAR